jgi:hypothetical protein
MTWGFGNSKGNANLTSPHAGSILRPALRSCPALSSYPAGYKERCKSPHGAEWRACLQVYLHVWAQDDGGTVSGVRIPGHDRRGSCALQAEALVEKPVCCAQLCCPLRLGGDLEATARAFLAVQNDMYTTGVMMQLQ